jgi:ABC-type dipeptide/oligopeptide/nickel transport system permease subunit
VAELTIKDLSPTKFQNQNPWVLAWARFHRNRVAVIGLAGLLLVLILILAAPIVSPFNPLKTDYTHMTDAPSLIHWWGTDDLGRDIFSRVIWGGRQTLGVGMLAVIVGLVSGTLIGLVAGYLGGWVDEIVQRIVDVMLAFPSILLMLSIVTILGRGLESIVLAVGLAYIPVTTRFSRGNVLSLKNREYIEAARALGATRWRIIFSHIFPNSLGSLIVFSSLLLGSSVLVTAGLNYIGVGARPPSPEWGAMLNYGRNFLLQAWWMSVFPGLAIFFVCICINMLGDGLREALDPETQYQA